MKPADRERMLVRSMTEESAMAQKAINGLLAERASDAHSALIREAELMAIKGNFVSDAAWREMMHRLIEALKRRRPAPD